MANLLLLQDKLGEDFKSKKTRRASKAAMAAAGKLNQESPGKELAQMPPKYQMKEDDDKQVHIIEILNVIFLDLLREIGRPLKCLFV
jgi:hypothetical protein